ncbi:hypothetical protein JOM56_003882 [Amanita muscaria]
MVSCQCNATIEWDDQALSAVCSSCGALQDSSQSLLVSQDVYTPPTSTTLKAVRTNWALAGQGKDARNRKNEYLMGQLINSLALSLNAPGLSPRAIHLFRQAMSTGLLWGRQAKRAAAVSVALALREANRPHHLHDIASLLNEPFPTLSRAYLSIASQLETTTKSADPSIYISTLHSYLDSMLQDSTASFVQQLRALDFRSVLKTAYSLCTVLTPVSGDISQAAAPMACAIFLLALESEARRSLQNVGDLAAHLGAKFHIAKATVMSRYKIFQDQIVSWIEQVPWLDKYRSTGGRAKVSRRTIVARGLKDAVTFQEHRSTSDHPDSEDGARPEKWRGRKKQKTKHGSQLQSAAEFLLNPNSSSLNDFPFQSACLLKVAPSILSTPHDSVDMQAPTRLQRLAQERGGSDVMQISDEELFTQGELDALFRTTDEIEAIRPILTVDGGNTVGLDLLQQSSNPKSRHLGKTTRTRDRDSHRINSSAFEQFMASSIEQGERDDDPFFGVQLMEADNDIEYDDDSDLDSQNSDAQEPQGDSGIVVDEWRPLSP